MSLGEVPDSGVYTVGYTGTLLAYSSLLGRLGLLPRTDLRDVPALVGDTLARCADAAEPGGGRPRGRRLDRRRGAGAWSGAAAERGSG